ncbi:glycosyltransferase family 2 protein [Bacillus massiliigorillae]|uniref:glycosyltransferase family 2 protein n=1 Tax=Bacillus massiliigorillae TaxID=1243664 RepID=UPI0003A25C6F|nr:glycosyltransferase family 2 protein [Bacillus massiliigorillae]
MEREVLLIIPAYNEEEAIEETLEQVLAYQKQEPFFDVIVINDGSTDRTEEILEQYSRRIHVVNLPHNLGIGGAVQTGYQYAEQHRYECAVQFDADGQHVISELKKMYEVMKSSHADMIIGSRFKEKTYYKGTVARRVGIGFFTYFIYLFTHVKIMDPTSGFRIKSRRVIEHFAKDYPSDYPEPEVIVTGCRKGWNIQEISVEMRPRQGGFSSIHSWKTIYYMMKVSFSVLKEWRK